MKAFLLALILFGTVSAQQTITTPSGGDLQAAINAAQLGDTIVLDAGGVYVGPFTLPNKSGSSYLTITSSRAAELPEGVRVSPQQSNLFAKLQSPNSDPVIRTQAGAHHYRFIGIEVSSTSASIMAFDLVRLGEDRRTQTTLDSVPHHFIFDRVYIHGFSTQEVQRGISLNSAHTDITNSYISEIHGRGYDTQAICGWNGPGPFRIINNYLEGAGENVMFGGADPGITNLVPSNIEIRRNHIFKPLSWKVGDPTYGGIHWSVKNSLELKNARNVVIDGNVIENNWGDAQIGIAILFTVRNQEGTAPWSIIENVRFTNNILKNTEGAFHLLGSDYNHPSQQSKGLLIANNLITAISRHLLVMQGYNDVVVEHNTHFQARNITSLHSEPSSGFAWRNNLTIRRDYGVFGDNVGEGTIALETYTPGYSFASNVLVSAISKIYPAGNHFPASVEEVGFVDYVNGDFRLSASSPYRNAGTDGKDIGADFAQLHAAIAGTTQPTPTPTPTPSPTPTPTPEPVSEFGRFAIPPTTVEIRDLLNGPEVGGAGFNQCFVVVHITYFRCLRSKDSLIVYGWKDWPWVNGNAERDALTVEVKEQGYQNIFVWAGVLWASKPKL